MRESLYTDAHKTHSYYSSLRKDLDRKLLTQDEVFEFLSIKSKLGFDLTQKEIYRKSQKSRDYYNQKVSNISDLKLLEHLSGKETYALPLLKQSKYVLVDIDARSNKSMDTNTIVKLITNEGFLGKPFFIEYSKKSKGYHLYYEFREYLSKDKVRAIEMFFKENYEAVIEIKIRGDRLRLPFSKSYDVYGVWDSNKVKELSFIECLDKFNSHEILPINKFLKKFLDPIIEVEKNSSLKNHIKSTLSKREFHYGCGTRFNTQFKIGFHVLRLNKNATLDDYIEACEFWNDGTSKDMKKPEQQKLKMLEKQWVFIQDKFEGSPYYDKESNENDWKTLYEDSNLYKIIDNEYSFDGEDLLKLKKIIKYHYQRLKIGKLKGKYQQRFVEDCIKTLEFLYGSKNYRDLEEYEYVEKEHKKLEKGVPFGNKLQKSVANHYNISNIRKVLLFLREINLLEDIVLDNGYSYSYKNIRFSIHFLLNSIYNLYYNLIYNIKKLNKNPLSPPSNIKYVENFLFQIIRDKRSVQLNKGDPNRYNLSERLKKVRNNLGLNY